MSTGRSIKSAPTDWNARLSDRRQVLAGAGILVCGVAVGATAMISPVLGQSRMSKAQANYQETPRGDERCANCVHFFADENACNLVEGEIGADAWCQLWMPEG